MYDVRCVMYDVRKAMCDARSTMIKKNHPYCFVELQFFESFAFFRKLLRLDIITSYIIHRISYIVIITSHILHPHELM